MHYTQMLSDFSEEEIAEIEAERDRDKALHPQKISAAAGKAGFPRTPFRDGKGRLKGFSKFFAPHRSRAMKFALIWIKVQGLQPGTHTS